MDTHSYSTHLGDHMGVIYYTAWSKLGVWFHRELAGRVLQLHTDMTTLHNLHDEVKVQVNKS